MKRLTLAAVLAALSAAPAAAATCAEFDAALKAKDSTATQHIALEAFDVLAREDRKFVIMGGPPMVDGLTERGRLAALMIIASECGASPRGTVQQTAETVYPVLRQFWLGAPAVPEGADRR